MDDGVAGIGRRGGKGFGQRVCQRDRCEGLRTYLSSVAVVFLEVVGYVEAYAGA